MVVRGEWKSELGGLAVWSLLRKVLEVVQGSGGGANREVNHSSGRIS